MEIKEIQKNRTKKVPEEQRKDKMKKLREEYSKMVKGRFEFSDAPGGVLSFSYRFFPEDLLVTYSFTHGEECEIPMGLVKHLNNTVKKVRTFNDMGVEKTPQELPKTGRKPSFYNRQSRVKFTPLEMY